MGAILPNYFTSLENSCQLFQVVIGPRIRCQTRRAAVAPEKISDFRFFSLIEKGTEIFLF